MPTTPYCAGCTRPPIARSVTLWTSTGRTETREAAACPRHTDKVRRWVAATGGPVTTHHLTPVQQDTQHHANDQPTLFDA